MAKTKKRQVGDFGENIAEMFLVKRGFEILERNYLRKWGEIDIIAKKGDVVHFFEVKSTEYATDAWYRPEDQIHPAKLQRLSRAVETYLAEKDLTDSDWQIDALIVHFDLNTKKTKIAMFQNIII
jgi:putative endonuclease